MKKLLVTFLVLAGVFQSGHQQGLDSIDECIASDDAFLAGLLGCFAIKFEGLLGGVSLGAYEAQEHYTGRRLQGFHHADDAIRNNFVLPRMMERFQKSHKTFMDNMAIVGKLAKQKNRDQRLMDQIKGLNMKTELNKYLTALLRLLTPVKGKLASLKQQAIQQLNSKKVESTDAGVAFDETVDTLCFFFPDLCPLIRMGACLDNEPEEAYEDGLGWLHCVYECVDLPKLSMCMVDLFNSTPSCQQVDWLSDIIIRGFVEFVGLGDCSFEVLSPTDEPIVLTEGGVSQNVEFITYMPPGAMCYGPNMLNNPLSLIVDVVALAFGFNRTCDVQIQFSTNMYLYNLLPYINLDVAGISLVVGRPKCGLDDTQAVNQVAIGNHVHASATGSCVIKMTPENWNDTFSIPLTAVVDHKRDGDVTLNFTMKYVVEGQTHYTRKILVTAVDNDAARPSTCSSINDPHITSFDGFYYNNLYHGYFYLYKSVSLPYQVQVIQQACSSGTQESCTCGVAVQSGDDVFVVDKCRRSPASCTGGNCHPYQVTLYTNGNLTPNTRIIQKNGGLGYDIILPHGTVVKIAASKDLLNVWISPSAYDKNQTVGLCGLYNEKTSDDLLLPNGTVYTGPGSPSRGQPREFNVAWRVPEEDRIFKGMSPAAMPFEPLSSCRCTHVIFEGVQCDCEGGQMVETCDMNLEGELNADNLASITRHSLKGAPADTLSTTEGVIDVDESYVPDELSWKPGSITEGEAVVFCNDLLDNNVKGNEIIRLCNADFGPSTYLTSKYSCIEDIQITGGYDWQYSALDSAKYSCLASYTHALGYGADSFNRMVNSTCIQDCNGNGDCVQGKCVCGPNYAGPDCTMTRGAVPTVVVGQAPICDKRTENCYFTTVFGQNFLNDTSLKCSIREATVDTNGIQISGQSAITVDIVYISPNQLACRLPSNGSYVVEVVWDGQALSPAAGPAVAASATQINSISYDSACYTCDPAAGTCSIRQTGNFCLIDGRCFAQLEENIANDCQLCNATFSTSAWSDNLDGRCQEIRAKAEEDRQAWHRDRQIRIGVSCGLSGLVVVVVVIIFIVTRKKEKKLAKEKPIQIQPAKTDDLYFEEPNTNANNATHGLPSKGLPVYDNAGLSIEDETFTTQNDHTDLRVEAMINQAERGRHGSGNSQRADGQNAQRERTDSAASQTGEPRQRTTSVSSVRSIGIGGGGPTRYSMYNTSAGERQPNTGLQGGSLSPQATSGGGLDDAKKGELIARF